MNTLSCREGLRVAVEKTKLSDNALRIYVYMITNKKRMVGPREIQRAMGFSSPSSATFHLRKLVEMGLVQEERGEYYIDTIKRVGILSNFFIIKRILIPKDLIYFVIVFTFTLIDTLYVLHPLDLIKGLALFPMIFATIIFFFNAIKEINLLTDLITYKKY